MMLGVQAEEAALKAGRVQVADGGAGAQYRVWNHWEFRVVYKSLSKQLIIGGIYVKLLMDGLDQVKIWTGRKDGANLLAHSYLGPDPTSLCPCSLGHCSPDLVCE